MNKGDSKSDSVVENNETPRSPSSPNHGAPAFFASSHSRFDQLPVLPENDESPIDEQRQATVASALGAISSRSLKPAKNSSAQIAVPKASATQTRFPDASAAFASLNSDADSELSRATVRERNAAMLLNDSMADVWFRMGSLSMTPDCSDCKEDSRPRLPAHSYVLATGSSVFYAMFYGGFEKSETIDVPDVDAAAFKILLKYLYTDEIELDADTVLSTLYAGKKYLVGHLVRTCIQFLENSLNSQNVCLLLSQSRLFEDEELMQRCWEVVDAQSELVLSSDGFLDIDVETMKSIVGRETLSCKETVVFQACIRWAENECANKRKIPEPSAREKRQALGPCFDLIRFPTMKVEELANIAAPSRLLEPSEIADLFLGHFARKKPESRFISVPRSRLPVRRCQRFQTSAYRGNQWRYRGRCDSIQFCTDRRIFVVGFGLYGSSNGSAEYKVLVELKRCGQILASSQNRLFSDGSSRVFAVHFDQPVQVEPEIFYTASVVLDGSELSYFGQEGLPEVHTDNVMFQFQCSTESTNGTGVQGGQIPEILFYG